MTGKNSERRYNRVDNEFDVKIYIIDDKTGKMSEEIKTSKSVNVSASGLLITAGTEIGKGVKIRVTFLKPNSFDLYKVKGEVIRVDKKSEREYMIAINFLDLKPEDIKILDYYINLNQ